MSAREIRLLQKKFILIAMGSIFLAMLFIGATVNLVTYSITRFSIDRVLSGLIESTQMTAEREYSYGVSLSDLFNPDYDRNVFYVLQYDAQGDLVSLYSNAQNSSEEDLLKNFSGQLLEGHRRSGQYQGFYYKRVRQADGGNTLAFLESSQLIAAQLRVLVMTLILGIAGMCITYLLVRKFSLRAIQPEIENSMRQKQFITNASHELKTPLAVIRANTDMIELTQGESEWTQSTLKQVDHLSGLIQNLVMIARSQEKEDRSALSEIDAAKTVNESIDPYEPLAAQNGQRIIRDIDPQVRLRADESKIRQLAALLIDNALKYCDEGGTIRIVLKQLNQAGGLRLIVSNDYAAGAGLDCSRFFDRFYREDASHNIDRGGYGIGLSIAESICRQYSGEIHAEWNDGIISFICQLK